MLILTTTYNKFVASSFVSYRNALHRSHINCNSNNALIKTNPL